MTVKIEPFAEATYDRRIGWVNSERKGPITEVDGVALMTRGGKVLLVPDHWPELAEKYPDEWKNMEFVTVPEDVETVRIGDPV